MNVKNVSELNVIFCGIVRDCAENLKKNLRKIEDLGTCFGDYSIIIVENDSKDSTKEVLRTFSERNPRLTYESRDYQTVTFPKLPRDGVNPSFSRHRIEKMARYRNRYLEILEDRIGFDQVDYVVIVDLDLRDFDQEQLIKSFDGFPEWDVLTANGRYLTGLFGDIYFDAYAFRRKNHQGITTEESIKNGRSYFDSLPCIGQVVEVDSAFGGLAIYKADCLQGMRYRVASNKDDRVECLCEHVTFHQDISKINEVRIGIDTELVIFYNSRIDALRNLIKKPFYLVRRCILASADQIFGRQRRVSTK